MREAATFLPPDLPGPADILEAVAARVPPERMDAVWLFPTRRAGRSDSTLVVVSAFADDRRTVLTAEHVVRHLEKGGRDTSLAVRQHGVAPEEHVERVVAGVLRRLDESLVDASPRRFQVAGAPDRFADAVATLREDAARPPR
jgi:hypothetical protein